MHSLAGDPGSAGTAPRGDPLRNRSRRGWQRESLFLADAQHEDAPGCARRSVAGRRHGATWSVRCPSCCRATTNGRPVSHPPAQIPASAAAALLRCGQSAPQFASAARTRRIRACVSRCSGSTGPRPDVARRRRRDRRGWPAHQSSIGRRSAGGARCPCRRDRPVHAQPTGGGARRGDRGRSAGRCVTMSATTTVRMAAASPA